MCVCVRVSVCAYIHTDVSLLLCGDMPLFKGVFSSPHNVLFLLFLVPITYPEQ